MPAPTDAPSAILFARASARRLIEGVRRRPLRRRYREGPRRHATGELAAHPDHAPTPEKGTVGTPLATGRLPGVLRTEPFPRRWTEGCPAGTGAVCGPW